jgi:hypothetical protein
MTNQPFFTTERDAFIPTKVANGPWDPNSLHGRVIIGLLAFVIEQRHGSDGFVPARLTVDMFRLPNMAPIEVTTKIVRDGLRIKVVEAEFSAAAPAWRVRPANCCERRKIRQAKSGRRQIGTCLCPRTSRRRLIRASA